MKNFKLCVSEYINKFDMLGYHKWCRLLSKLIIELSSKKITNAEVREKLNNRLMMCSIKYLFDFSPIDEFYPLDSIGYDVIELLQISISKYRRIQEISEIVSADVELDRIKSASLTRDELTNEAVSSVNHYSIIKLNDNTYVINCLIKFYLLTQASKFSLESIVSNVGILQDNYIPTTISNYLSKNLGCKVYFMDDCLGSNYGSHICMFMTTNYNNIMNPVFIAPIGGINHGIVYNLFNCPQEKGEYTQIAQIVFGIKFEEMPPVKQFFFTGSRLGKYSAGCDLESIVNTLAKVGITSHHIEPEIPAVRGNELGTNMYFNALKAILDSTLDSGNMPHTAFKNLDMEAFYIGAYQSMFLMSNDQIHLILCSYVNSQICRLFYIASAYLDSKYNMKELTLESMDFEESSIWDDDNSLVSLYDYKGICMYIVNAYYTISSKGRLMNNFNLTRLMKIINLFYNYPLWYSEILREIMGFKNVVRNSIEESGSYSIEFTNDKDGNCMTYNSVTVAGFIPNKSVATVQIKPKLSEYKIEKLRVLSPLVLMSHCDDIITKEDFILDENVIVLINPDTLSSVYLNKETLKLDLRYPAPSEVVEIRIEGDLIMIISGSEYYCNYEANKRTFVLKKRNQGSNIQTRLGGYKTNLFSQEDF